MADSADAAHQVEEADRQRALDATLKRAASTAKPLPTDIHALCIDCQLAIEPARLVALRNCTSRCASCANEHEERMRYGR